MRWAVFCVFALLVLTAEIGLRRLWSLPIGPHDDAAPSLLLVLGVFVSLSAPRMTVYWAMIILGVLSDLRPAAAGAGEAFLLVGPGALGFLLAGAVIVRLRPMLFQDRLTSVMAMTLVGGAFMHLAVVLVLTLRGLPLLPSEQPPNWSPADQLLQRGSDLAYSTLAAAPLGWLLRRTRRWWAFAPPRG